MATDPENWGPFATGVKAGSIDAFIFSFFPDLGLGWQTAENRTCQSDGHSAEVPRGDQHHRLPQSLGVSGAFEWDFLSRQLGQTPKCRMMMGERQVS